MGLTVGELVAYLNVDSKKFDRGLGQAQTRFGKFTNGIGNAAKGLAVGALGALAAVIHTGWGEVMDASAGQAQLEAGIKSTGNAANVTVRGMQDLASSIQAYSGQTDDSIVKTESLLLTFTNIKNVGVDRIFDQATIAAANMAAKMGGEASTYAMQLGKALNDPVKGVTALTRMGVQFTAGQKASIAAMTESGNVMGAQKIILGELTTQFGGAAKAAGESLPGQLQRAKRAWEDFSEGAMIALVPVLNMFTTQILPAIQRAMPQIQAAVKTAMGALSKAIQGVFNWGSDHKELIKGAFRAIEVGAQTAYKAVEPLLKILGELIEKFNWLYNKATENGKLDLFGNQSDAANRLIQAGDELGAVYSTLSSLGRTIPTAGIDGVASAIDTLNAKIQTVKQIQAEKILPKAQTSAVIAALTEMRDKARERFSELTFSAEKSGKDGGTKLVGGLTAAVPLALAAGKSLSDSMSNGVSSGQGKATGAGKGVGAAGAAGMGTGKGAAGKAGSASGTSYASGVGSKKGAAKSAGTGLANAAKPPIGNWFGIGANAGASFASGISSAIGSAIRAGSALADRAMAAAQAALDINSPSKRAIKLGASVGEGFTIGIKGGTPQATTAAVKLALAVASAMSTALSGFASAKSKRLKAASEFTGPVESLISLVTGAIETLTTLSTATIPVLEDKVKAAAVGIASVAATLAKSIGAALRKVFPRSAEKSGLTAAGEKSGLIGGIVDDVVGLIQSFAELTGEQIDKAILGIQHAASRAPDLASAVAGMVKELQAAFVGLSVDEDFATTSGNARSVVDSIAGTINALFGLYPGEAAEGATQLTLADVVARAIDGANLISSKAADLGIALRGMMDNLKASLGDITAESVAVLRDAMDAMAGISGSVKSIVGDLAEIDPEKITRANAAGNAVGGGFLAGLSGMHTAIVNEAQALNRDIIDALAGGTVANGAGGKLARAIRTLVDTSVADVANELLAS